jgi:hypothetical protein
VKFWKNKLYLVTNLRKNVKVVIKLVTSYSIVSIVQTTMVEITVTQLEQIFACTVASQAIKTRIASSSRGSKLDMAMPVILIITLTSRTTSHKIWFSWQHQRMILERAEITKSQIKVYLM